MIAVLPSGDGAACTPALAAADRIVLVNDPLLAGFAPEPHVAVLESIIKSENPRAVLIGSTSLGLDVGPLVGAKLGVPVVKNCQALAIEGGTLKATASVYGGKLLADVALTAAPAILLVAPGAFRPTEDTRRSTGRNQGQPGDAPGGGSRLRANDPAGSGRH